jgi:transglutaminase-like putative cysteine protease
MTVLHVTHRTTYLYKRPVEFGEHRLMSRPRDSHDLRLLETTLVIDPPASSIRWIHDVFGNSIAIASFRGPAEHLTFEWGFRAEHFPTAERALEVESYATQLPFSYSAEDAMDLAHTRDRHYPDPDHKVDAWAKGILERARAETLGVLVAMTAQIQQQFRYEARDAAGVQSPLETLESEKGSCRDFAVFMMEAARSLGLAARFVSGYLYDEKLTRGASGLVGGGATHAWAQVFLPGAGWVELDPTNALVGGRNLIRVGVARDAPQAAPLTGSYNGAPEDFDSMKVEVQVEAE